MGTLRRLWEDPQGRYIIEWGIVALVTACLAVVVFSYLRGSAEQEFPNWFQ